MGVGPRQNGTSGDRHELNTVHYRGGPNCELMRYQVLVGELLHLISVGSVRLAGAGRWVELAVWGEARIRLLCCDVINLALTRYCSNTHYILRLPLVIRSSVCAVSRVRGALLTDSRGWLKTGSRAIAYEVYAHMAPVHGGRDEWRGRGLHEDVWRAWNRQI